MTNIGEISIHDLPPRGFISSRLMAAIKMEDVGTLHMLAIRRDEENRLVFHTVIEDYLGRVLYDDEGKDENAPIRSMASDPIFYRGHFGSLLSFLLSDAEAYAHHMGMTQPDDPYIFGEEIAAWAYSHDQSLTFLDMDINPDRYSSHG